MSLKPCIVCGEPTAESRCEEHTLPGGPNVAAPRDLGYDTAWDKLSRRARKIQPWCSECFTNDDLTGDHSAKAWKRKAEGKSIRLRDVDVLCRSCNTLKGKARGGTPTEVAGSCADEAKSQLYTPKGYAC